MKRKMIFALIGIFAIAAITTFADARPGKRGNRGDRGDRGMMHGKMMSELNLTDAQKEKLQTLRSTHQKEMIQLRAAAKIAQLELQDVLRQDKPKNADVKTKIAAANAASNKVTEARIMNRLEGKKVFTPEQIKKMQELKSQHNGRNGMREGPQGHQGQQRQFHGRRGQHGHGMMPGDFEAEPSVEEPATNM
ncbi:MAG: Spy/CpxP family protein refolding chaperone [Candidatus Latescibacterota bacterium]|jgi:Spy/CpxP family protein refolding chaperone